MNTYDLLWLKILNDLESTFNEETYADVFEPLKSTHKYANGHVYVLVASEFIKNRINRLYLTKINELAAKYNGSPIRFKFVTESELLPEETLTSPERNLGLKYRPGNLNA